MISIALLLLVVGLVLLWYARRRQKESGLPAGRIIYSDTHGWKPTEEPFYDPILGLTGKPDYLVQQGDQLIPIEVKSSRVSAGPYDGHIFQLAAYCLLVQRGRGKRPAYGILRYPNRTFAIDFTPTLETHLQELLEEMRAQDRRKEIDRSHENPARCRSCGYRSVCDQKLVQK